MSAWTVFYTRRALGDLDGVFADYEAKATGLGDRFVRRFKDSVARLETNPYLFGEVKTGVRATPIKRFPQVIYYRVEAKRVVVLAVRHDPRIWKRRT